MEFRQPVIHLLTNRTWSAIYSRVMNRNLNLLLASLALLLTWRTVG